jgi:hypothetical protein
LIERNSREARIGEKFSPDAGARTRRIASRILDQARKYISATTTPKIKIFNTFKSSRLTISNNKRVI